MPASTAALTLESWGVVMGIELPAVEPLAPGQVARYDDEFEVRAFGDNITKWGTSVVLIETGPYAGPDPDRALVRLNFVALVSAKTSAAEGGRARLAIDTTVLHFFDRETGESIYDE